MSGYFIGRSWAFALKTQHMGTPCQLWFYFSGCPLRKPSSFSNLTVVKQQVVYSLYTRLTPVLTAECLPPASYQLTSLKPGG